MTAKPKTKAEIDKAYSHHAMMYGHNARVIKQFTDENAGHLTAMQEINAEGMALVKAEEAVKAPPSETL